MCNMICSGLKISVLGDSISTYEGFNPYGYSVYYRDDRLYDNEMDSVNDTWWKRVIDGIGGELCVNNSFSGSFVAGEFESSACSEERCSRLHGDVAPDIILIYMGSNDRGFKVEVGLDAPQDINRFYGAYRTMLQRIGNNYPSAKIVCGTLLMGKLKDSVEPHYDRFTRADERYNDAIRSAVKENGCLLADLARMGERYETLDYCHPTKDGHRLMAKLWLESLKSLI